jgi:hypothetical protein
MKTLAELRKELAETRKKINAFVAISDMDEQEAKELDTLNGDALKLKAKITAMEQVEAGNAEAEAEREAETEKKIKEAVEREAAKFKAASRRPEFGGGAPYQAQFSDEWKYDNLDGGALSLAIDLQKSLAAKGAKYVDGSDIVVQPAAIKALARRIADFQPDTSTGEAKKNEENRQAAEYVKGAFKMATGIDPTAESIDGAVKSGAFKAATDPMYTGGSGIGSDWVGTAYSSEIWRVIRAENLVVKNVPEDVIPDGYSSKVWPLESTDFTWYKTSEATASDSTLKVPAATVAASQLATSSKTITVGKFSARGIYTGELTEDSIIAFAPQARLQLETSGKEVLESAFIDGDVETSASKNINAIDTTPTSTNYYLNFDGFRKLALVTNTANSRSAGGTLTIDDFIATMQLMGTAGLAGANPAKVNFIVDGNVHYALARLPEVKTRDVNSAATVENGFVARVYGVGVIPSWQMHKASAKRMTNNAGKIDADTDSNNLYGAIVCVRWDQWKQAYKRRMTIETTRIANADSWEIVAHMRIGLAYRDNEASAETYFVGV